LKWTKRFRETRRGAGSYLRERVDWIGLVALAVFIFAVWAAFVHPLLNEPPAVERDFVGRVVDKSLTIRESQDKGSRPSMRLLVEDREGRRFRVGVTGEFYERARVGMWVSRRVGELKLHSNEPAPGGDAARVEAR
jgi:hypothetical protein